MGVQAHFYKLLVSQRAVIQFISDEKVHPASAYGEIGRRSVDFAYRRDVVIGAVAQNTDVVVIFKSRTIQTKVRNVRRGVRRQIHPVHHFVAHRGARQGSYVGIAVAHGGRKDRPEGKLRRLHGKLKVPHR